MRIDEQTNEVHHQLVEDLIFEMEEHWSIPRETTAIVITAFFGKFRKTLRDGSFDTMANELFEIIKDIPSTREKYLRNLEDERGTDRLANRVRIKGRFAANPRPL